MSAETQEWLSTRTLIGLVAKRGKAWHYRKGDNNHYDGAIPWEDVNSRLFNFDVNEQPLFIVHDGRRIEVPGSKAMVASDTGDVLGIHKKGYQGHSFRQWLLENLSDILDQSHDELVIGSAGLLQNRAVAWVQIEKPDNLITPEGVEYRPNILATTSFNGTIATTYKETITVVVCDNTRDAALSENGSQFKLRHTKHSSLKLGEAAEALGIIHSIGDTFAAEVAKLCNTAVSENQWEKILKVLTPLGTDPAKNAVTLTTKKRDALTSLYMSDPRCAPWNGTGYGVVQAFNTYNLHETRVNMTEGGTVEVPRVMRNMENILKGKIGEADAMVMATLQKVCK